jgi:hemoglobin
MIVIFPLALGLGACSGAPARPTEKSLYERLGGPAAMTSVVDDFVANVTADARINGFFSGMDIPRLKSRLVEQFCAGSGGPCRYRGRSMGAAHAGMGVTEAHFNALMEDLAKTLDRLGVPLRERNELLGILGPMKHPIVAR